jgi:hypothetical protein
VVKLSVSPVPSQWWLPLASFETMACKSTDTVLFQSLVKEYHLTVCMETDDCLDAEDVLSKGDDDGHSTDEDEEDNSHAGPLRAGFEAAHEENPTADNTYPIVLRVAQATCDKL